MASGDSSDPNRNGRETPRERGRAGSADGDEGQVSRSGRSEPRLGNDDKPEGAADSERRSQGGVTSEEDMTTGQGTGVEGGRS